MNIFRTLDVPKKGFICVHCAGKTAVFIASTFLDAALKQACMSTVTQQVLYNFHRIMPHTCGTVSFIEEHSINGATTT